MAPLHHADIRALQREAARAQVDSVMAERVERHRETSRQLMEVIHERAWVEAAMRKNLSLYKSLAEVSPVGIFLWDASGDYVNVNERWAEIAGMPGTEAYGSGWLLGVHGDDRRRVRERWLEAVASRSPFRSEFRYRTLEGKITWVYCQAVPTDHGGGVGTVTDVTDLHEVKDALARLNENLDEIVRERTAQLRERDRQLLQAEKMTAIGSLASGIAHDFNNLLTVIQGHCALLAREVGDNRKARAGLDQLRQASRRAVELTQQLAAFSLEQVSHPEDCDVNLLIQRAQGVMGEAMGENIELMLDLAGDAGQICVDPEQFEQVLRNLGLNACDAMPDGGVLRIATRRATRDGEPQVRITISDIGDGMSPELAGRIFEPFFSRRELGQGNGLGLSVVYGILTQHRASIKVHSEPGSGTAFEIDFPSVAGCSSAGGLRGR